MRKTILVIEDDQNTRKIYLDRFKIEGFDVITTPTGEEGLEYAMKRKPDVILLDILLSGKLGGLEVLKRLKEDLGTRNIPVIVLSNIEKDKAEVRKMGAEDYLVKADTSLDAVVNRLKARLGNSS